jgi:TetR/AcrR family transcriptional regulator, transcriptional repressor for nem operon
MARPSHRDRLVEIGTRTVHERGFATAGIREITAAAGVAQGSFTNHFASKDQFGVAVLEHYFGHIRSVIASTLRDTARPPAERLRSYFDAIATLLEDGGWRFGCLAGNMSLEAAEHSEAIRAKLGEIFAEWTPPFAEAVREAQRSGEVDADLDPEDAGAALLEAWHGAMLRMKVERSVAPLDRFRRIVLPGVLGTARRAAARAH